MGFNTTVVVYNDALDAIARDPAFGRNLAGAVMELSVAKHQGRDYVDVPAGNHCNAAMVVESHHADNTTIVSVGGNLGVKQHETFGWNHHTPEGQERLLREWADKLGFRLVKKSEKKT